MPGLTSVSRSRRNRTGELPRDSGPTSVADCKNLPCQRRSKIGKPSTIARSTSGGIKGRRSAGMTPR